MDGSANGTTRVVIVGGGISGLSVAARLAGSGLSVTVLEASRLGFAASTRNQGWLFSGAWFAPDDVALARMCYESLQHTLRFCPECAEPDCGPMVYLAENAGTDLGRWTASWESAGIPYRELAPAVVSEWFPSMARSRTRRAFALPDRAIRPDRLLEALAEAGLNEGVEIRSGTSVTRLIVEDGVVRGVETRCGEAIPADLVILAGNARGGSLVPGYGTHAVGSQSEVALVAQKTHLVALRPGVSRWPFCVLDAGGFNHMPHPSTSVFGSNRWLPVHDAEDERADPAELRRIWDQIGRLFPSVRREDRAVVEWAGTTVQAMHVHQIEPGRTPLPTVVDHSRETPCVENLLSVYPGRASLWPQLAQQTHTLVLRKLAAGDSTVAAPPWGELEARVPETVEEVGYF